MKYSEARERLLEIAEQLSAFALELRVIEKRLARRLPTKKAAPKARSISDPKVRAAIRDAVRARPDLSHREIGRIVGVDGGRVTDVMRGVRR